MQRRNVPNFKLAAELARSGKLGQIQELHASIYELTEYDEPFAAEPEPDPSLINWDEWLGPAADRPFNMHYCWGGWKNQQGLATAWRLLDWGAHTVDICQWAIDADGTTPIEFEAISNSEIIAKYANGIKLTLRRGGFDGEGDWIEGIGTCPVRLVGDQGWVEAGDFMRIEASDPRLIESYQAVEPLAGTNPVLHARNFLDCVRTRNQPVCNTKIVRYGHMACFAAAISWRLGRKVRFDPVKERFIDDKEADRLLAFERRAPYTI
jgi:predicted dehydrogenase